MTQAEIDALRSKLIVPQNHLIDGRNLPSEDGGVTDVISPINGQCITTVAAGTSGDAARAIQAARAAFEDRRWAGMPPVSRALHRLTCRLPSVSVSYSNGLI